MNSNMFPRFLIFSIVILGLLFSISSPVTALAEAQDAPRPNIVLILADDLGYSDLGCYGGEISTPNIDGLAAGGIRFRQFYNTTRCCPSRASINTGLYPHQAGIGGMSGHHPDRRGYEGFLTDRCVTTAEVLKAAGYRTYMSGKWHMHEHPNPIDRGFDEFFGLLGGFTSFFEPQVHTRLPENRTKRKYRPDEYYATDVFTDYALDFLADSRKPDENGRRPPFFLYLAYTAPHFPLHAPQEEIDKYAETYLKGWDAIREERYARQVENGIIDSKVKLTPRSSVPKNWVNVQTGWADKDNPAWDTINADRRADLARRMAIFAAMVDRMDQNIGRIVADLEKHGDMDNTLIIFLSDNGACAEWDPWGFDVNSGPQNILHKGDELKAMGRKGTYHSTGSGWANTSNTPWRLYKHYIHEGGIRTPLIAHWPRGISRKGSFESTVGHIIDFMPTFLELAGAEYPAERNGKPILPVEGRSLVPAFQEKPDTPRVLYWEHEGNRGIRDGNMKLVWIGAREAWELYDLSTDPMELDDQAEKRPEIVQKMAEAWETWAQRALVTNETRVDRTPGLKLHLDFSKKDNAFRDLSGKENSVEPQGTLPVVQGGRMFDGRSYVNILHSGSLHFAETALAVEAAVVPKTKTAVILAYGGSANGFSLALRDGYPVFTVTIDGVRFATPGTKPVSKRARLRAVLDDNHRVTVSLDGEEIGSRILPGFLPRRPNETIQIGLDRDSQVNEGYYPGFKGTIEEIKIYRGVANDPF